MTAPDFWGLGEHRRSHSIAVTSALNLGGGRSLVAEAAWVSTDGASAGGAAWSARSAP